MMNDQENTIEKIKQTALDEFFMHGYNKASLRTICSRAGVTTGAMYFYFKNKEALFREIFEPLVVQYEELLVRYMKLELAEPELGTQLDVQMMQFILEHRKEAVIILEKAQGSCYEMYRSKVEQLMEQSIYTFYKSRMDYEPDEKLVKILAKIRLDGCLEIIKGNYSMINEKCPGVAINTEEYTTYGFRNCLGCILKNSFSFNGPIISELGKEISTADVYAEYCEEREKVTLDDLKKYPRI